MHVPGTSTDDSHLPAQPHPGGLWYLGPFPVRAYALCILTGIAVAVWWTRRRWAARGGAADEVLDVVMWAVPFGILGGRLYHVITDPELYFAAGKQPVRALYIWDGGLGIWGAVALGAVGAWIGCRRRDIRFADFADAVAPALVLAQGSAGGATTSTRSSTAGRGWVEALRIDLASHFFGLRLNDWTSLVVFVGAVAFLAFRGRRGEQAPGPTPTSASAT